MQGVLKVDFTNWKTFYLNSSNLCDPHILKIHFTVKYFVDNFSISFAENFRNENIKFENILSLFSISLWEY